MARRSHREAYPPAELVSFAGLHHSVQAGHLLSPTRDSDDESGEESQNKGVCHHPCDGKTYHLLYSCLPYQSVTSLLFFCHSADLKQLFVFGYAANIFKDDETAAAVDHGKFLVQCMADGDLLVDRYASLSKASSSSYKPGLYAICKMQRGISGHGAI
jgi:hypothetical protein